MKLTPKMTAFDSRNGRRNGVGGERPVKRRNISRIVYWLPEWINCAALAALDPYLSWQYQSFEFRTVENVIKGCF